MEIADDYDLISVVAAHRSGVVWKARDTRLNRLVAVKTVESPTPQLREQWRAESRILAGLDHPNVVRVFGYLESDDDAYIVEEWLEGATLAEVLADAGAMTAGRALGIVRGSLQGLSAVHAAGLVHGDVSSTNILIGVDGTSRLIDFGSASVSGSPAGPATGAFRSPEGRTGGPATPATDVYAAAAVTAMLLRGRSAPTPTLDGVTGPVRAVLAKAMSADPGRRYRDAAEFLAALEEAAACQFGAVWWTEVGVGALATSALAGGAATLTSIVSRDGSVTAGQPERGNHAAGNDVDVTSPAPRPTARALRLAVAGGVTAAVIAAGVYFATRGSPEEATPAAARGTTSSTAAGVARATNPIAAPTPILPPQPVVGRFQYRSVINRIDGLSVDHVGQVFTGTWTFTSTCISGGRCVTSVDTPGGPFALAASRTMIRKGVDSIRCPRADKPQLLTYRQILKIERGADGLPIGLSGTGRQVATGCGPSPTITYYDLTVTPS